MHGDAIGVTNSKLFAKILYRFIISLKEKYIVLLKSIFIPLPDLKFYYS